MCLLFCEQIDDSSAPLSLAQLIKVDIDVLVQYLTKKSLCFVLLNVLL